MFSIIQNVSKSSIEQVSAFFTMLEQGLTAYLQHAILDEYIQDENHQTNADHKELDEAEEMQKLVKMSLV